MIADGWMRQRRRVRRLNRRIDSWKVREDHLRRAARAKSLDVLTRFETLAVIGATGAVWASRLKENQGDERSRPFLALIGATLLVHRWRRYSRFVASRLGLRKAPGPHHPAESNTMIEAPGRTGGPKH